MEQYMRYGTSRTPEKTVQSENRSSPSIGTRERTHRGRDRHHFPHGASDGESSPGTALSTTEAEEKRPARHFLE
jgi:hypothetical protein